MEQNRLAEADVVIKKGWGGESEYCPSCARQIAYSTYRFCPYCGQKFRRGAPRDGKVNKEK